MPPKIDQFVPLVPTMPSAESREFQITIIPQGEQALQNGVPATGNQAMPNKHGGPTLSVQRDNGQITHIKIQCNCGQMIDVECVYGEAGKVVPKAKAEETPKAAEPPRAAEPPAAKAPPKAAKAAEAAKERKPAKGRK